MYHWGNVLKHHVQNYLYGPLNLHSQKQIYQTDSVDVCEDFVLNTNSARRKINTEQTAHTHTHTHTH